MAVVTYEYPTTGVPAAVQVKDLVTFTIVATASAGVAVAVTHNMNISVADLALGFPEVILEPLYGTAGTEALIDAGAWIVSAKAANTVTLTKAATGGAPAAVIRAHVLRPHTIGR